MKPHLVILGAGLIFFCSSLLGCQKRSYEENIDLAQKEWSKLFLEGCPRFGGDTAYSWDIGTRRTIEFLDDALSNRPGDTEGMFRLAYAYQGLYAGESPGTTIPFAQVNNTLQVSTILEDVIRKEPLRTWDIMENSPRWKMISTWGTLAYSYAVKGNVDSLKWAYKELKERGGLTDAALDFGRNMLATCDSDAILFVYYDPGTFILPYIQLLEGFRRDVTVVSYPLLNTSWYVKFLRKSSAITFQHLDISITDEELEEWRPKEFLPTSYKLKAQQGSKKPDVNWLMQPTLDEFGQTGIWPGHALIRDMILSYSGKRPINISFDVPKLDLLNLDPWLIRDGLVFHLQPVADYSPEEFNARNIARLGIQTLHGVSALRLESMTHNISRTDYSILKYLGPAYSDLFLAVLPSLPTEKRLECLSKWKRLCSNAVPYLNGEQRDLLIAHFQSVSDLQSVEEIKRAR